MHPGRGLDIGSWLRDVGMAHYEQAFRDNAIGLDVVPDLTDSQLRELGVAMGDRIRLLQAAQALRTARSAHLAERGSVQPQPGAIPAQQRAERRQLTVMFVDLVGSTRLSTEIDPEVLGDLIHRYQRAVAGEVKRFDGSVAKFMGDGVLAYFGWPHAHEDDAERAVRSGLALLDAVMRLPSATADPLSCRVGIATGLVVVGDLFQAGGAREETLVGETPNLAARLQQVADAGALVICPETRRLVGELFSSAALGAHDLKGFSSPVHAWRVLGEATQDRFAARHAAGMSPLFGREEDLHWLTQSWDDVRKGAGCVRVVTGEAGIGKSRLVTAIIEQANQEHTVIFRYGCSPYHVDSALWPVIGQLEQAVGLARAEEPAQQLERLEALVSASDQSVQETVPLLAELLGLPTDERYPRVDLPPAERRARTLGALTTHLIASAARTPALLVVEDAHWLDPTTTELLDRLIARLPFARMMALVTARPGYAIPWAGLPRVQLRTLSRLSSSQATQLIEHIAAGRRLSEQMTSTILSRTEGVPLFVEELTKTVLESTVGDDVAFQDAIPATLQGSLLSRLDRLGSAKEVAQLAACIGREFAHDLLAAVAELDTPTLDERLRQLCHAELLFAHGEEGSARFSFKHALVRDAAYESLLKSRRHAIHGRIADEIEQRFPALANAEPELVAQHLTHAAQSARALQWWVRAGRHSLRRSAFPEANRQLSRALDLLRQQPASRARDEEELGLLIELGPTVIHSRGWAVPELDPLYRRALDLARELDRPDMLLPSLVGRWQWFNLRGHYHDALKVAEETFGLAAASRNEDALLQAHHLAFPSNLWLGEVAACRRHIASLLQLYNEERHADHRLIYMGHDPAVCAYAIEGTAAWVVGDAEEGYRAADRACALGRRIEHIPSLAHGLWLKGMLAVIARDANMALIAAEEVLALARDVKLATPEASAQSFRGWALVQLGQVEEGVRWLEVGLSAWRAQNNLQFMPHRLCLYAEGLLLAGRRSDAVEAITEALQLVERNHEAVLAPLVRLIYANILLVGGRSEQARAEEQLNLALRLASDQGFSLFALRIASRFAQALDERGERARAHELLASIVDRFGGGPATRDLTEAKAMLSALD